MREEKHNTPLPCTKKRRQFNYPRNCSKMRSSAPHHNIPTVVRSFSVNLHTPKTFRLVNFCSFESSWVITWKALIRDYKSFIHKYKKHPHGYLYFIPTLIRRQQNKNKTATHASCNWILDSERRMNVIWTNTPNIYFCSRRGEPWEWCRGSPPKSRSLNEQFLKIKLGYYLESNNTWL